MRATVNSFLVDTSANAITQPFGVKNRQVVAFETLVDSGTGSWALERKGLDGAFVAFDVSPETFQESGLGPHFINLEPGEYRVTFTGSGGGEDGGLVVVKIRDA